MLPLPRAGRLVVRPDAALAFRVVFAAERAVVRAAAVVVRVALRVLVAAARAVRAAGFLPIDGVLLALADMPFALRPVRAGVAALAATVRRGRTARAVAVDAASAAALPTDRAVDIAVSAARVAIAAAPCTAVVAISVAAPSALPTASADRVTTESLL
jgi:hypothetical protein